MHISIEGFDGVGKTTAAKLLAEKTGFIFVEKPLKYLFDPNGGIKEYLRIRDYFNEISPQNPNLSACFYGLGNMYIYQKFKDQDIVTDRHILSNYAWSGTNESIAFFDTLYSIVNNPSFTFILYADAESILNRLQSRDAEDSDIKKVTKIKNIYEKMEYFAKKHNMPYLLLDSTNKSPEQIVDTMIETLRKEGVLS